MMTEEEALSILKETSADEGKHAEYSMRECDKSLDLSIIVPVYNHADTIPLCIDSLLYQKTSYRFEVILVDDGSTDGADKVVDSYKDNELVRIIHQENSGIASARNTGIAEARGVYIMFADCDDSVEQDIVEELMSAAYRDSCDIAMCAHDFVKCKNGKAVSSLPYIYPQRNLLGYKNGDEVMNYAGLPWGKVYRRELFEKVRFFPGYWYEDTIVHSLLYTQCERFSYVPKVMYHYYWHKENFSHVQGGRKTQPKMLDRYWLIKAICKRYEEMQLPVNAMFYTMLLKHLSMYYYATVKGFPKPVIQAMFVLGRELLLKFKPQEEVSMSYMLELTEKAILSRDIALWKLCSLSQ
ncbi:MAG: glycosyltransferase [Mogibacterium sp.]|nr:glycosyltransferase [Mogibacterium sp.]